MLVFPNCKINLGLNIVGKRTDGYHNLETIFYPIPYFDALEIIKAPGAGEDPDFTTSGLPVSGNINSNLCIKAWQLLQQDFSNLPAIKMHLHKSIAMGAGLGGGSSDGAFTLQLVNDIFDLGISTAGLLQYALQLGSDCPFFIINKPCFATSRGEVLEPVNLSLKGYYLVLVNPGIHISTKEAFGKINPETGASSISDIIKQPVTTWKNRLTNDFEPGIFKLYPAINHIKELLYNNGAIYSSMTGTGSTVFGIFEKEPEPFLFTDDKYLMKTMLL
ncbi:MAG: 4-(cytidine 5'-diphospho)-2-C-methyl-D-erythritol kinase [Bacteroidota bacterium]